MIQAVQRWLMRRRLKPMTDVWGVTPDEFVFIIGLIDELRRHQKGHLPPHEAAELREIMARPSTKSMIARMGQSGVLDEQTRQMLSINV